MKLGDSVNIAYLILAHKNPDQFKRLINRLEDDVYVHIDKKSDLSKFYVNRKNVKFINERVSVNWGGFSMVEATLNLIRVSKANKKYDYYVLLSGDDYIIKNLSEFKQFLKNNKEYSFLEHENFQKHWHDRYRFYKISENNRFIDKINQKFINIIINKRKMFNCMIPYKGSQWWCLNNECVEYVIKYIQINKGVINYFKHTHIPDESFFQTILLNSHLKNKIINDNLRYIILEDYHPEILTIKDYEILINQNNKFFARKFDMNIDNVILDKLDKFINKKI